MFSEQRAQIDGTVDCSALMETVHDFIKNEISEASPEDYKKLIPIWNVRTPSAALISATVSFLIYFCLILCRIRYVGH